MAINMHLSLDADMDISYHLISALRIVGAPDHIPPGATCVMVEMHLIDPSNTMYPFSLKDIPNPTSH
jgi:hypothetical protein